MLFLVYALAYNSASRRPNATDIPSPQTPAWKQLVDTKGYMSKVFPEQQATLQVRDTRAGDGPELLCGQDATVQYEARRADGSVITEAESVTFHVGAKKVMPALDQGVIGMRVGGERRIVAPYSLSYGVADFARDDIPKDTVAVMTVTLESATPPLPAPSETQLALRVFDLRRGGGDSLNCGDSATVNITAWGPDGARLFQEQGVTFTLGARGAPMGLEQAVQGMQPGGLRQVTLPPNYLSLLGGGPPAAPFDALPAGKLILLDVEIPRETPPAIPDAAFPAKPDSTP